MRILAIILLILGAHFGLTAKVPTQAGKLYTLYLGLFALLPLAMDVMLLWGMLVLNWAVSHPCGRETLMQGHWGA